MIGRSSIALKRRPTSDDKTATAHRDGNNDGVRKNQQQEEKKVGAY